MKVRPLRDKVQGENTMGRMRLDAKRNDWSPICGTAYGLEGCRGEHKCGLLGWGQLSLQSPLSRFQAESKELTIGAGEAEDDHTGDGPILQDCPCLQNLCVESREALRDLYPS